MGFYLLYNLTNLKQTATIIVKKPVNFNYLLREQPLLRKGTHLFYHYKLLKLYGSRHNVTDIQ